LTAQQPGASSSKLSYDRWCKPERIDDPQVFETALGASPAEYVLGDMEASRRLRGGERAIVVAVREDRRDADHRLTKILVQA
jgi:hypothetical protein